ncbi:MAG: YigZ family protein [Mucinivorans sp.]
MDCYKSISSAVRGEIKEKGSRFIAYAFAVTSADEVKDLVAGLRAEHHAARHCTYAYRIGASGDEWRANDDGEPSGTAGRPILGQILSRGLSDTLVVVVRYFGGTLLGVPGLIAAYRAAASDALDKAEVIEKIVKVELQLTVDYALLDKVLRTVKSFEARVVNMSSDEDRSVVNISVRQSKYELLVEALDKIIK